MEVLTPFWTFLLSLAFVAIIAGSYTDIKTREVPDWVSIGLIIFGLGTRLIFSLTKNEWHWFLEGVFGLVIFFALAWVMFYSGQWGGGDSKLLMGLGAVLGIHLSLPFEFNQFGISFVINTLIAGAVYGMIWALVLGLKNKKIFIKEIKKVMRNPKMQILRRVVFFAFLIWIVVFLLGTFTQLNKEWKLAATVLFILVLLTYYIWLFTKTVENACMYKRIPPEKLTEGDWMADDIIVKGKRICGPKDLGIEKKQIKQLIALKKKKLIKTVLIKEGIPFIPSFLLGFVITFLWGNVIFLLL